MARSSQAADVSGVRNAKLYPPNTLAPPRYAAINARTKPTPIGPDDDNRIRFRKENDVDEAHGHISERRHREPERKREQNSRGGPVQRVHTSSITVPWIHRPKLSR